MATCAQIEIERLLHQQGAVSRRDHPELARSISWLAESGRLSALLPGVYVSATDTVDPSARINALVLSAPHAVLTRHAAAFLTFWPDLAFTTVDAAVGSKRQSPAGFRFERRRIPAELIRSLNGAYVTTAALTALDLVPVMGGHAIDQVLRVGAATLADLQRAFELSPGRRGNRERCSMLLDSRDLPWAETERLLHRLLRDAGVTGWGTNVAVRLSGSIFFLDVAFEGLQLAIELDGWQYHARYPLDFDATMRRHSTLASHGWQVLHFTWSHLVDDPEWVLRTIVETIAGCERKNRPVVR